MLTRYHSIHFRDYMAIRLTPLMGTMAYPDRMGDDHASLVETGRLVQGHPVSGPLDQNCKGRRRPGPWRSPAGAPLFHTRPCRNDRRFQRGLFDLTHAMRIGQTLVPGPAALLCLLKAPDGGRNSIPWQMSRVLQNQSATLEEAYEFEYGLALLKTSAAQVYTIRLAQDRTRFCR